MSDPADPRRRALGLIIRALERYPSPIPVPPEPGEPGSVRYVPPIRLAMGLYAERFQRTDEEDIIKSAFAALAPKVLERCQALIGTIMNAIVDGSGCPPETRADYMALLGELSTLATVFVGPAGAASTGPYAPHYTAVCEMISGLMQVMTR